MRLSEVGKKTLELLAESGALDAFHTDRAVLKKLAPTLVDYSESLYSAKSNGQRGLFEMEEASDPGLAEFSRAAEEFCLDQQSRKSLLESLRRERELLGSSVRLIPFNHFSRKQRRWAPSL